MGEPTRVDVAIVGGGLAGLSAAYTLAKTGTRYRLVEASPRFGGQLRTLRTGAYLFDEGPDGFIVNKPDGAALCREIGLGNDLIETIAENRRVFLYRRGALHALPRGIMLAAPTDLGALARSPLFTAREKARMALDLVLPARRDRSDESIASFIGRRLGDGAIRIFAEPLLAGIYAGDPARLSIQSTFPQLVAMERQHGGLIRGARALRSSRPKTTGPDPSPFLALRNGMQSLVDALVAKLDPSSISTGVGVQTLERHADGWRLRLASGEIVEAHRVILTVPPRVSAVLLDPIDGRAGALLRTTRHLSAALVYLSWLRSEIPRPLDASGFLVPRGEGLSITASTWVSSKWPGRAPEDEALIRVFFGGARDPDATAQSDDALIKTACADLGRVLGVQAAPRFAHVARFMESNPQPEVGHAQRLESLRERLVELGDIHVAGGGYDSVGIPDTIKYGRLAGEWAARA